MCDRAIELIKLHITEALKQTSEKVSYKETCVTSVACTSCKSEICEKPMQYVRQFDILNAYSLTNIK